MSSFSFPNNGSQPTPSPNNLTNFPALTVEGAEMFEPDYFSTESDSMAAHGSMGGSTSIYNSTDERSLPIHRSLFLDPHQELSGSSTGQQDMYRSPSASDSERLHQFGHDAWQFSDVTGITYPFPPMGGFRSALGVGYPVVNGQGYGSQGPVTSAGSSQPPVSANADIFNPYTTINGYAPVAESWSHNARFHQGLDSGRSQRDLSRLAFSPSQETGSTYRSAYNTPNGAWGSSESTGVSMNMGADVSFAIEALGGSTQAYGSDNSMRGQHTAAADKSPHNSQASEPTNTKQRPKQKPRKPRARKASNNDEDEASPDVVHNASKVPEPDATYAFTVTDWDDVYLDPKPTEGFGTHEPHLAKKVADVSKRLRTVKKGAPERTMVTMTQLHASIKARAMILMSQPGPRPQTSKFAPRKQWDAPINDFSIPTTAAAYAVCLHLLVNAIINREDCMESENAEFKNRYYPGSTYFTEKAVYELATQILDELIDLHENGFWHQTLDPDYDERYRKTQDFNFRDRFNLVARILKHSKNTCNELFKNFRLHDVIGGAYDLEVRVWSNYKNNKVKADKEKKRKEEETAKEAEKDTSKNQGTKRSRAVDEDETPNDKPSKRFGSSKQTEIKPSSSSVAGHFSSGSRASMSDGNVVGYTSSSTALAATQKPSRKALQPKKVTAATRSAGQRPNSSETAPATTEEPNVAEASLPTIASTRKTKSVKRRIETVDKDPEPPTASRMAPPKGKGKAKSAADEDSDDALETPPTRRKTTRKTASSSRTTRDSTRTKVSSVGSPTT